MVAVCDSQRLTCGKYACFAHSKRNITSAVAIATGTAPGHMPNASDLPGRVWCKGCFCSAGFAFRERGMAWFGSVAASPIVTSMTCVKHTLGHVGLRSEEKPSLPASANFLKDSMLRSRDA